MKRKLLGLSAVLLLCVAAAKEHWVQWTWDGLKIHTVTSKNKTIELGLREDGFVVWREISATTNCPAESESKDPSPNWTPYYNGRVLTNGFISLDSK